MDEEGRGVGLPWWVERDDYPGSPSTFGDLEARRPSHSAPSTVTVREPQGSVLPSTASDRRLGTSGRLPSGERSVLNVVQRPESKDYVHYLSHGGRDPFHHLITSDLVTPCPDTSSSWGFAPLSKNWESGVSTSSLVPLSRGGAGTRTCDLEPNYTVPHLRVLSRSFVPMVNDDLVGLSRQVGPKAFLSGRGPPS